MKEFYHKWYSQYIGRDFEMLVFGYSGQPVILFPPDKCRYYECKDRGMINSAAELINTGQIKIYCPDTFDSESWYNYDILPEDRVKFHHAFEQMILNDVINFAKYETEHESVIAAGSALGGYHALNIALKHPNNFHGVIALGGKFDIKRFLHGFYNDECYFNNPVDYLPDLEDERILNSLQNTNFIFGIGEYDSSLDENKYLYELISTKNLHVELDIKPNCNHDWSTWNEMFPKYIKQILPVITGNME